jgi:transposase
VDNKADKDTLIEALLLERDELYQELSKLRQSSGGALDHYETIISEKDNKIQQLNGTVTKLDNKIKDLDDKIINFEDKIRQLTDQLAWYRRKFWKASSEKYIPQDPSQRRLDFDGVDILPQEEEQVKEAAKEIVSYQRRQPEKEKRQPVRLPLPDDLRREEETIEPEGIDENWTRIGEEITEVHCYLFQGVMPEPVYWQNCLLVNMFIIFLFTAQSQYLSLRGYPYRLQL